MAVNDMSGKRNISADELPGWLKEKESYIPVRDKNSFAKKTSLSIMKLVSKISDVRSENSGLPAKHLNSVLRMILLILVLIVISLMRTGALLFPVGVVILVFIALQKSELVYRVVKGALIIALFSAVIVLPSVIINQSLFYFLITGKVFLSGICVLYFCNTADVNEILRNLKKLHFPGTALFILDMTIKYIGILGRTCLNMLEMLDARTIGRIPEKYTAVSGVAGMTFIKSKEISEEMFEAMECRGFTGNYE